MSKTFDSFVSLRAVALAVVVALTMWSLGLPGFNQAQAANVANFSVTLSDSAPGAEADHTIEFTVPSGMAATGIITLTFADFGGVDDIEAADVELDVDGTPQAIGTDWTISSSATTVVLTSVNGTIDEDDEVVIRIGSHTASGENQIVNPGTPGSYVIDVDVAGEDSGETQVAIVDTVLVSAAVDTTFTFTVSGVAAGQAVNGTTTTGGTTATTIPFGTLVAGVASTTAQDLSVETNAANGFAVTVQSDGPLSSTAGGVIQGFVDGSNTTTPTPWSSPSGDVLDSSTWGHWGLTSNDATSTLTFGENEFVAVTTAPTVVFSHDGPADALTQNAGIARVGYQIEITALQPAGDDYTTTLTYIATPVF